MNLTRPFWYVDVPSALTLSDHAMYDHYEWWRERRFTIGQRGRTGHRCLAAAQGDTGTYHWVISQGKFFRCTNKVADGMLVCKNHLRAARVRRISVKRTK